MSLFPAYSSNHDGENVAKEEKFGWQKNNTCPEEVGALQHIISQELIPEHCTGASSDLALKESAVLKYDVSVKESYHRKSKKKSHKSEKHAKKHRHKEKSSSKPSSRVQLILSSSKSVFVEDFCDTVRPLQAFFIDTKGSKDNLTSNNTHYTNLARYSVLIKYPLGKSKAKKLSSVSRYYKRKYFERFIEPASYVRPFSLNVFSKSGSEYIPLILTFDEQAKAAQLQELSNEAKEVTSTCDDDVIEAPEVTDEELTLSSETEYFLLLSKQYNKKLAKRSSDISLWLEFVKFQDKAFPYLFSTTEGKSVSEKRKVTVRALAERKLAILDSAIKKNISARELYFYRVDVGSLIWDDARVKKEWATLIFNFSSDLIAWGKFLTFSVTHFTSFSYAETTKNFERCLIKLLMFKEGRSLSATLPENLGKHLVDVTFQVAKFWHHSGFMERAVALFQALLDFNLRVPEFLQNSSVKQEAKLALFEQFWDCRAARFGESNSSGWANVIKNKQTREYSESVLAGTVDREDELLSNGGSVEELWIAIETYRERSDWLPWEEDPEDCEDPERIVDFEVVGPFLYCLQTEEEKFYLMWKFLMFLGIPVSNLSCDRTLNSSFDFTQLFLDSLQDILFLQKTHSFIPFDQGIFRSASLSPSVLDLNCSGFFDFICNLIHQMVPCFSVKHRIQLMKAYMQVLILRIYAYELDNSEEANKVRKKFKKEAKNILKMEEYEDDLSLYVLYINLLIACKLHEEASRTCLLSLNVATERLSLNLLDETSLNVFMLLDRYIHLELSCEIEVRDSTHFKNIVSMISSYVVNSVTPKAVSDVSSSLLLKTMNKCQQLVCQLKSELLQNTQACSSVVKKFIFAKYVLFLALLSFYAGNFHDLCNAYEGILMEFKTAHASNSDGVYQCVLKYLYEDYVWISQICSSLSPSGSLYQLRPEILRQHLNNALKIVPNSHFLLAQLLHHQTWKDLIKCVGPTHESSIVSLIFHVLPHVQKVIILLQGANSDFSDNVGTGFHLEYILKQALSCMPGQHCPLLWRLYLILVSHIHRSILKDVAYQAMTNCPFVKSIYLDCVYHVPSLLPEVLKILSEKGMRIRMPLEELQILMETEPEMKDN